MARPHPYGAVYGLYRALIFDAGPVAHPLPARLYHPPKQTSTSMTTYRTLNRYANSDLSEFRNLIFGHTARPSGAALQFGQLFHAWVLEGITPTDVTPARFRQLQQMREAVLHNAFARTVLETALTEHVHLWDDAQTGLLCKSQTDIWVPESRLLVDLKTTSAQTYGEFLQHCEQYSYDRQAAYYLDGAPDATRFVLLGVQKKAPFTVFYFEASACRGCVEGGRKKYQRLLGDIQRNGFTPSSWQLEPAPTS